MTKKHYEMIALAIKIQKNCIPLVYGQVERDRIKLIEKTITDIAFGISREFQRDNKLFSQHKFLEACGVNITVPCIRCGKERDVEALLCSKCPL